MARRFAVVAAVVALAGIPVVGAVVDPVHGGAYLLAVLPFAAAAVFAAIVWRGESA